jgi:DNA-nicking Smr family endonuclease
MDLGDLFDRALAFFMRAAAVAVPGTEPRLDLHGLGVRDAIAATERFLAEAQRAGTPQVRIVYGKGRHSPNGRGVLREVIPRWLAADGSRYVASATPVPDAFGDDGAMHIELRAPEPWPAP